MRKMYLKRVSALLLAGLMAATATGCSKGSKEETTVAATEETTKAEVKESESQSKQAAGGGMP
ncbi:hypothetical protein [Lacrimispora xylanisolvens]|uniref:hypothetical protein n=1 Tax=Lacrimispora xylanisolvens TaxID=384636 RepID=UPI00240284E1